MNDITESILKTYKPRLMLVLYTSGEQKNSYGNALDQQYIESHVIGENGEVYEGKPLMQETLDGIVDVFFDDRQNRSEIKGFIPGNILSYELLPGGKYSMIWYRPEERRQLYFAENLHLPSGKAWVPPMLYKASSRGLYVYALKSSDRPKETDKLFKAPFYNIYNDGQVCLGSARIAKPKVRTYANVIKYWEDLFWLSEFSSLHGNENPTKSNINTLWKGMIGKPKKWSDMNELIPHKKKSLKDLL